MRLRGVAVVAAVLLLGAAITWWTHRPVRGLPVATLVPERANRASATALLGQADEAPRSAREASLALVSTSVADLASRSTATVLDLESGAADIVGTGDTLSSHPEIAIETIGARWVELTDGDRTWVLELASEGYEQIAGFRDLQRILGDPDLSTADRVEQLLAADAGERTVANIFSEASFAPYIDDEGELAGLVLTAVQPNGFHARLGIASGDVLLEINGLRLDRYEALEEATGLLHAKPSLHLLVQSNGEVRRLLVDVPPGRALAGL